MLVEPARQSGPRLISFLLAAAVLTADRATKLDIQAHLPQYGSVPVIQGFLRVVHAENPGAAFSFLADSNPLLRNIVLIGISSAVLLFVVSALWSRTLTTLTRIGLGLVLGGACGNLYDRVIRHTVTDFIEVYHGGWSFPAFNVADSAITIGAAMLLLDLLFSRQSPAASKHVPETN